MKCTKEHVTEQDADGRPSPGGWFKVPNAVLDQFKTIGPLAFGVFCTLAKHANAQGVAWPSIRTIAANLGMAHRSVMRAISALETCGLIWVARERAASGSRAPNKYHLTPQLPGDTGKTGVVTPGKQGGDTRETGVVTPEHTELDPIEQDPLNKKRARAFRPPTPEEVQAYCRERGNQVDPEQWYAYYQSNGWRVGRNPMKDWRAAVRTWEKNGVGRDRTGAAAGPQRELNYLN